MRVRVGVVVYAPSANLYEDSVHCADATSVSPEGFHPELLQRFVANGYLGDELARVDWRAMCIHRPDWGTHYGWAGEATEAPRGRLRTDLRDLTSSARFSLLRESLEGARCVISQENSREPRP